ncbi:MAG: FMN-binding negative transcriptional regulator, partial [Xanthomonadales bacterium]|nr:FMN-binding negative transcriptional regulator [Xanthomonadales bacterium]
KKRDHKAVPTWNYTAVHARGLIKFIHDKDWLLEHLTNLSNFNEQNMPKPWHLSEAPEDYIKSMLPAIVGFEMEITNMSGQSKMSQNHNEENRQGVISGLQSQNKENVATWVKNPDMS